MSVNPAIFRAYDIRGVYPIDFDAETVRRIGQAFAEFVRKKRRHESAKIAVGRDFRASSDILRQHLVEGIIAAGADCYDLGVTTTPALFFSIMTARGMDGGAMITASHNPPEFNGFKFALAPNGEIGETSGLTAVKKLALAKTRAAKRLIGRIVPQPERAEYYLKALQNAVPRIESLSALVDAAGGAASLFLPKLLSAYPIAYKPIHFEPDPIFREHPPNPLEPAVDRLIAKEYEDGGYQLGAVFDGDGDRVAFFDEKGDRVRADIIFALLAAHALAEKPGARFVFELTHSRFLGPFLEAHGGKLITTKVGGVHVRAAMKKHHALLGGEISAHVYHQELGNIDSGLLAMLKVMRMTAAASKPLSELAKDITSSILQQFAFPVRDPERGIRRIEARYRGRIATRLDGVTVDCSSWWFNIRKSNTEALLRLTIEAETESELKDHLAEVKAVIGA